ncbi:MAG: hypothetical protein R2708_21965 [Vicinamibacterales bacterium]
MALVRWRRGNASRPTDRIAAVKVRQCFAEDAARAARLSLRMDDLLVDVSAGQVRAFTLDGHEWPVLLRAVVRRPE